MLKLHVRVVAVALCGAIVPWGFLPAQSARFVRGDANADAQIDVTDAIFVLNYLFVGGKKPPCMDAADINDSGGAAPDISDPVYLLSFLFLGGPAPPLPGGKSQFSFKDCGADPTADAMGCVSFRPCMPPKDDNPCIPDVEAQFRALKPHADTSGFYAGRFSGDTKCIDDCDCTSHYQGIVRGPGPGVPYLYISKNCDPEVLVVQMGSRDTDGERLRSNRLAPNATTEFTLPPPNDAEITTVKFDDLNGIGLNHAGGMQAIGDTLAVPVDCNNKFNCGCDESLPIQGVLVLLDISNPARPTGFYRQRFPYALGGVAIAKLPDDGRYLLVVGGGPGVSLTAFVSNSKDLHNPGLFEFVDQWSSPQFGKYEGNFSIVKQCDGQLYLIGTFNPNDCGNPVNGADLWKLNINLATGGIGSFGLEFVKSINLICTHIGAGVACDFQAAGGTYVSPSGELIIYGTVHQRGDPFTAFAEFRNRDVVHPTAQPWAELYSETSGWNKAFGQTVIFDYEDRYKDDFLNFTLLDFFDNTASSVRWWAPVGDCIELITNTCDAGRTGTVLTLEGSGQVESIANLANTEIGDNNVSAIRFCSDADEPFRCLDVGITDIDYPSPVVSNDLVPITVSIRNFGGNQICNTVTACIGVGPGSNCRTEQFCVGPFDTKEVTVNVRAPLSPLNCGSVDNSPISACLNFFDPNLANNCRNETIGIVEEEYEYFDLALSILDGPDSAGLGDDVNYSVRVINRGNTASPSCVSFITGITCGSEPGDWRCVLDGTIKQIGTVLSGKEKTFDIRLDVPNCCVPPIIIGQQWLKVEILYADAQGHPLELCDDDCGEGFGNNFDRQTIKITR